MRCISPLEILARSSADWEWSGKCLVTVDVVLHGCLSSLFVINVELLLFWVVEEVQCICPLRALEILTRSSEDWE